MPYMLNVVTDICEDTSLVPAELTAATNKLYLVALDSPVTTPAVALLDALYTAMRPAAEVTLYTTKPDTGEPPDSTGAFHTKLTVLDEMLVDCKPEGARGAVDCASDELWLPSPALLYADTVSSYTVPPSSPVIETDESFAAPV